MPAPPIKSWFWVMDERPVPPRVGVRVPVVSVRAMPSVEVAMLVTKPFVPERSPESVPIASAVTEVFCKLELAVVEVAMKFCATTWPATESFAYGEVVPIPTLPFERNVARVTLLAFKSKMFPLPCWLRVRRVCADEKAIVPVASLLISCVESNPSRVSETNAEGTEPKTLRGVISPSHAGVVEPPISTPKYKG